MGLQPSVHRIPENFNAIEPGRGVTVFDKSPAQLVRDCEVADRGGLRIAIGAMRW